MYIYVPIYLELLHNYLYIYVYITIYNHMYIYIPGSPIDTQKTFPKRKRNGRGKSGCLVHLRIY